MNIKDELVQIKNDLLDYYTWLNNGFVGYEITGQNGMTGWLNDKGEIIFTGLTDCKGNYITFVVGKGKVKEFGISDCDGDAVIVNIDVKMFGVFHSNADINIAIHALISGLQTSNRSIEIKGFETNLFEIIPNMFRSEDEQVDVLQKLGLNDMRLIQIDFTIPITYDNMNPSCFDNICLNCK